MRLPYSPIFILFILLLGNCSEKKKPLPQHAPLKELEQKIIHKTAQDLFDAAYDNYENGKYKLAMEQLEQALEIENNPIIYNKLGIVQLTLENYEKAIDLFKKGQKLDPEYWPVYINEARCYIVIESYEKADKVLNDVIILSKSNYWKSYANFYLALRYFNDGNQCSKSVHHFNLSKEISQDEQLIKIYTKIEEKLKNYCG